MVNDRKCCSECGRALDAILHCLECAQPFTVALSEQRFFESKGLALPKRCPDCRRIRRELKETGAPRPKETR